MIIHLGTCDDASVHLHASRVYGEQLCYRFLTLCCMHSNTTPTIDGLHQFEGLDTSAGRHSMYAHLLVVYHCATFVQAEGEGLPDKKSGLMSMCKSAAAVAEKIMRKLLLGCWPWKIAANNLRAGLKVCNPLGHLLWLGHAPRAFLWCNHPWPCFKQFCTSALFLP